jgi:O-antigen/teichoic acid export membrane protein
VGVIQKGSSLSTSFLIIGVLLGFVTSGLLLPNYFTEEENGVITLINSYFLIYSQIALIGLHTTVIRFYPHFRNDENKHHGFLTMMSLVLFCSVFIFSLLFFISQWAFPSYFSDGSLFMKYYWLVLPLTVFTVYFYLFDAYYTVQLKGARGFFLKDVLQRILIILLVFAFIAWKFNFNSFIVLYGIATCIPTLILMVLLLRDKQISFRPRYTPLYADSWKYMAKVSGYSLLLGISWVGVNNIDAIMIERMIGLKEAGIYGRNMFFGVLVAIPYRAINKISSGVISNSFKENNMKNIRDVYYKSSLNQMILGIFIFLGIWLNIENVYHVIPRSYESGKYVILFMGLGNLFTMVGGVNTAVISFSPYYRWNTLFVGVLLILVVINNLVFIPLWQITGAAVATALSVFLYNLIMYLFLWYKYQLQPINVKHLLVLIIAFVSFMAAYYIPTFDSFIYDIIIRSAAFTILFWICMLVFKVSMDMNGMLQKLLLMTGINKK